MELQQLLCLRSIRMLQDVSTSLQVGNNSNCVTLKPSELFINIQLDEIYVKPNLHYNADRIVGNAENKEQTASRIQCLYKLCHL